MLTPRLTFTTQNCKHCRGRSIARHLLVLVAAAAAARSADSVWAERRSEPSKCHVCYGVSHYVKMGAVLHQASSERQWVVLLGYL